MSSPSDKPTPIDDAMRDEYDFSQGVRGKHFERYWRGQAPIRLDPDLAEQFSPSGDVNAALRDYQRLRHDQRRTG